MTVFQPLRFATSTSAPSAWTAEGLPLQYPDHPTTCTERTWQRRLRQQHTLRLNAQESLFSWVRLWLLGLIAVLIGLHLSGCQSTPVEPPNTLKPTPITMVSMDTTPEVTSEALGELAAKPPAKPPMGKGGDLSAGKLLYESRCGYCHGQLGEGLYPEMHKKGIAFNQPAWQKRVSDTQLNTIIQKGRGAMPAYEGLLTPAERQQIVVYIRSLAKTP